MKIRAVLFDIYGTLMQVGPPPADADARWQKLLAQTFSTAPTISRLEFAVASSRAIERRHAASHARGIQHPEILWPSVVAEVLPAFCNLTQATQDEFVYQQIQIGRTIQLISGAAEGLHKLATRGCQLGLASNAQAYSVRELREALAKANLDFSLFNPALCFWSYEHGFSKPNPHVFQILDIRLEVLGITADKTLMVGDRLDNDIEPARAQGWQTWHLSAAGTSSGGDWTELLAFLERNAATV
jgi:putative hydrolase of the HAD superfamily